MSFKENYKKKMYDTGEKDHLMKNYIKRRERAESRVNGYSYFLAAVCAIIAVLFFVYGSVLLGFVFIGIGGLPVLLVYLSKKAEEKENKNNKKD